MIYIVRENFSGIEYQATRRKHVSSNIVIRILEREGISQKTLAEKLKVGASSVSKWKKGERIPYEVSEKLSALFPWTEDPLDVLCGNTEVAQGWRKLLIKSAKYLDADGAFEDWHRDFIAELLSDLGIDLTLSVAETAKMVDDRTDGHEEYSLEAILSCMIQNSCWAAEYTHRAADWDENDELIEYSYAVEGVARDWGAVRWLCDEYRAALGVDDEVWSRWCGKTRLRLREVISDYLQKRKLLGLDIEIDPFSLESTDPSDLIYDLQDLHWEKIYGIEGHFSLAEKHMHHRLANIECVLSRIVEHLKIDLTPQS